MTESRLQTKRVPARIASLPSITTAQPGSFSFEDGNSPFLGCWHFINDLGQLVYVLNDLFVVGDISPALAFRADDDGASWDIFPGVVLCVDGEKGWSDVCDFPERVIPWSHGEGRKKRV